MVLPLTGIAVSLILKQHIPVAQHYFPTLFASLGIQQTENCGVRGIAALKWEKGRAHPRAYRRALHVLICPCMRRWCRNLPVCSLRFYFFEPAVNRRSLWASSVGCDQRQTALVTLSSQTLKGSTAPWHRLTTGW